MTAKKNERPASETLLLLFVSIPITLYMYYVIWAGWGWFLEPLGAPKVGYWFFLGVAYTVGLATKNWRPGSGDVEWDDILLYFIRALFAHGILASVHTWAI